MAANTATLFQTDISYKTHINFEYKTLYLATSDARSRLLFEFIVQPLCLIKTVKKSTKT